MAAGALDGGDLGVPPVNHTQDARATVGLFFFQIQGRVLSN